MNIYIYLRRNKKETKLLHQVLEELKQLRQNKIDEAIIKESTNELKESADSLKESVDNATK